MIGGAHIRYPEQRMFPRHFLAAIGAVVALGILSPPSSAQKANADLIALAVPATIPVTPPIAGANQPQPELPDAPVPQVCVEAAKAPDELDGLNGDDQQSRPQQNPQTPTTTPAQNQSAQPDSSQTTSSQSSSSSQSPVQQPSNDPNHPLTPDELKKKAQEQLEAQEHQRVMGVMATFNTTADRNAAPLSPKQKFQLFFKSSTDPWPFLLAGVIAGIGQADDSEPAWGQGAQGYAKRFGAGYSDAFIGNFFGNAVLPIALHEDPRYFQKGTGSFAKRALWAAGSTVWCKRDKGGWGPNYANVFGNLIGSAISTAYKPATDRNAGDVITDGLTVSAEGIVGAEVIEFWPDLVRMHRRKQAAKLARQAAQQDAQHAVKPTQPAAQDSKPDKPQD